MQDFGKSSIVESSARKAGMLARLEQNTEISLNANKFFPEVTAAAKKVQIYFN